MHCRAPYFTRSVAAGYQLLDEYSEISRRWLVAGLRARIGGVKDRDARMAPSRNLVDHPLRTGLFTTSAVLTQQPQQLPRST